MVKVCEAKTFQYEKHTNFLGVAPIAATVSTRITCLVGDSYKPSILPGGNTQGPWDSVQEATGATKSWGPGMKTEIIFFGFGDCYKMQETYSAYHHKWSVNNHNHRTRNILNPEINSVFYWTRYSSLHPPNIYTPKIAVFQNLGLANYFLQPCLLQVLLKLQGYVHGLGHLLSYCLLSQFWWSNVKVLKPLRAYTMYA